MLEISQTQADALASGPRDRLAIRLDGWMSSDMPGWANRPQPDRHAQLRRDIDRGADAGLQSETDFALFVRLMADLAPDEDAFLARADVAQVMGWQQGNPGGKLRALYQLAGRSGTEAP